MIAFVVILCLAALLLELGPLAGRTEKPEISYRLSEKLVEPGQPFKTRITLVNRGRFVVPFLRIRETIPSGFRLEKATGTVSEASHQQPCVSSTVWLKPRERVIREQIVSASKRGRYVTLDLSASTGDFLGLRETPMRVSAFNEVVVMPEEAPEMAIRDALGGVLGDVSVRRFLLEDPVLTMGYREYTGREPMRSISWNMTARRGELMVKNYDHTLEASVSVVLDCDCSTLPPEADKTMRLEECLSIARTVCRILEEKRIKYDFYTNVRAGGMMGEWPYVSEGLGERHFLGIMEGLGRAVYSQHLSGPALYERAAMGGGAGRGRILIAPGPPAATRELARLREAADGRLCLLTAEELPDTGKEEAV